jgi:hypothetical protein
VASALNAGIITVVRGRSALRRTAGPPRLAP